MADHPPGLQATWRESWVTVPAASRQDPGAGKTLPPPGRTGQGGAGRGRAGQGTTGQMGEPKDNSVQENEWRGISLAKKVLPGPQGQTSAELDHFLFPVEEKLLLFHHEQY